MKLDDLAKLAGVSRTTASYVVNGKAKQYRVSDKTIEKVTALIRQHNFKPNTMAASLRAGKTNSIGLIIPDFENTSYARIAYLLEIQCRQLGYQLIISCSNDEVCSEMDCANQLLQRHIDALIVASVLPAQTDFYQGYPLPVIGLDRTLNCSVQATLQSNDEQDAFRLAEQLVMQPINNILFISALQTLPTSQAREKGFERALDGKVTVKKCYAAHFHQQDASQAFSKWLTKNMMPEAIFTTSLTLLQGVLATLVKQIGQIPPQLVFATFGNHDMLDLLPNRIICLEQPYEKIVQQLLEQVLSQLKKHKSVPSEMISRELIWRNKCKL